jgi:hypothetical protein
MRDYTEIFRRLFGSRNLASLVGLSRDQLLLAAYFPNTEVGLGPQSIPAQHHANPAGPQADVKVSLMPTNDITSLPSAGPSQLPYHRPANGITPNRADHNPAFSYDAATCLASGEGSFCGGLFQNGGLFPGCTRDESTTLHSNGSSACQYFSGDTIFPYCNGRDDFTASNFTASNLNDESLEGGGQGHEDYFLQNGVTRAIDD